MCVSRDKEEGLSDEVMSRHIPFLVLRSGLIYGFLSFLCGGPGLLVPEKVFDTRRVF